MNLEQLINHVKTQAKIYLNEAHEFFPYGANLQANGSIVPVGVYVENYIDSRELIEILEQGAKEDLENGKAIWFAMGIDISLNSKDKKENAILIKATKNGDEWYESVFPYYFERGEVIIK